MITVRTDDKDSNLLAVSFPADPIGNDLVGHVPGRRWSYSRRCWLVPNTRDAVVQLGKLFGKDYCRFDEAVVWLYKPTATNAEVEQATNPLWPPVVNESSERVACLFGMLLPSGNMTGTRLSKLYATLCVSNPIATRR